MIPVPSIPYVPPVYRDVHMSNGTPQKVLDTDAVQTAFNGQQAFNDQIGHTLVVLINKVNQLEAVFDWVKEHYPEVLAQYEANKQWLERLDNSAVCETTEK